MMEIILSSKKILFYLGEEMDLYDLILWMLHGEKFVTRAIAKIMCLNTSKYITIENNFIP